MPGMEASFGTAHALVRLLGKDPTRPDWRPKAQSNNVGALIIRIGFWGGSLRKYIIYPQTLF